MQKSSDVVVFHQQETEIDKEKLNYFLSEVSVWGSISALKKIYMSL